MATDYAWRSRVKADSGDGPLLQHHMKTKTDAGFTDTALPTAAEQEAEQARLEKLGQLEAVFSKTHAGLQEDLEQAQSELMRELGVRERCYAGWIDSGKISRIDARERFTRLQKALDIVNFMLDITGKHVTMTTEYVPF